MATQYDVATFTGSAGTQISGFTTAPGAFERLKYDGSGNAEADADPLIGYVTSPTPSDANEWAQCTLAVVVASEGSAIGPCVRMSTSADTWYGFLVAGTGTYETILYSNVSGSYDTIASDNTGATPATGNVLYIEAQSTALVCKINGSNRLSTTSSSIAAAGRWGVFGADDPGSKPSISTYTAGDFSGGAVASRLMLLGVG